MKILTRNPFVLLLTALIGTLLFSSSGYAAEEKKEDFNSLVTRLQSEKPKFAKRQQDLLNERYDLSNRPVNGTTMSRGKAVQEGVRVKLPGSATWEELSALSPEEIKNKNLWPAGFLPLPHPHHEAGGMIFPKFLIDETKKQTDRDVSRFDLDF